MGCVELIFVSIILLTIDTELVTGIECYNCSSNQDIGCSEKYEEEGNTLRPQSCGEVFEARYCIKTTGIFEGEIGTKRFCSSRDYGNYCEYIRRIGDEREYRSCVYTCTKDGCNSTTRLLIGTSFLAAISIVTHCISKLTFQ